MSKSEIMTGNYKSYKTFVRRISRDEFNSFYQSCIPDEWFTENEIRKYSAPGNIGSLAGRYLIKKTICDFISCQESVNEIEILNADSGKPVLNLGMNIRRMLKDSGIRKVELSISHSRNYFTGMTIFCF